MKKNEGRKSRDTAPLIVRNNDIVIKPATAPKIEKKIVRKRGFFSRIILFTFLKVIEKAILFFESLNIIVQLAIRNL
jgi:hypothetical protein